MKPESQRFGSANFVTVRVHRQECGDCVGREHTAKLSQLDCVLVHRGLNGRPFIYELVVDYRELDAGVANLVATIGQDETPPSLSPTTL